MTINFKDSRVRVTPEPSCMGGLHQCRRSLITGILIIILSAGCESYKKTGWYTPDNFSYTLSRSRMTGELTDYLEVGWSLK